MTELEKRTSPPLSTRECADFMGVSTAYVLAAIAAGDLRAERLPSGRRTLYRIHEDDFVDWLKTLGWKRLPRTGTD